MQYLINKSIWFKGFGILIDLSHFNLSQNQKSEPLSMSK